MAAPSKVWVPIADSQVDADSPGDTILMTGIRDNQIHLREWLGGSYAAGAAVDHDHDGANSKFVASVADGAITYIKEDRWHFTIGDVLLHNNPASVGPGAEGSMKMRKQTVAGFWAATLRVKYTISGGGANSYWRLYVNGIAVGTYNTNTGGTVTYTDDITGIVPGDLIQVYGNWSGAGSSAVVTNLNLYVADLKTVPTTTITA